MNVLRPLIFLVSLLILTLGFCGVISLIALAHPALVILFMMGGLLGLLLLLDLFDDALTRSL